MAKWSGFFAGAAVGAALVLAAGGASALTTFPLTDTLGDGTNNLNTSGELTGGDSAVSASAGGVSFLDVGYFAISPGELLTSYDVTSQGTSKVGEISGGEAGLYEEVMGVYDLLPSTVITLSTATPGVVSQLVTFSGTYALGPGNYAIGIASAGVDTVSTQGNAKFSVTLEGAAVPEPATWAAMLIGFGGIGASMRLRRRVTA
jgi:hypothetical protein